ncbi:Zeta toxin domain containing protein [uncultured Caudovirales phage]|uniref:Zeta toxin domain containing protein n=1 Tax=uncultured Caudovirales phage TaxID=2100421 RepID=A0A6J5NQE1_9CAUD|nr:Zeta toxin domain containing protein [uncultured Caudovirales phage]
MTTCTYSFTGADDQPVVITGKAAFKDYLLNGGLQQLLPGFGPQGMDLNAKLEQKIFSDFDKAVEEYSALPETKNGKLLDTDQARELSAEYRANRSLAPKVHEAASAFTQRAFEQRMAEAPDGGLVLFMAGGGGAGKSSAEDLLSADMDRANTILDGTLSSYDKAARNIQLALDNNQSVRIVYVYREPVEAMRNGVLTRAMKRGRTVTIDAVVKGHAGSSEVVRKLQTTFGDNPNFKIKVIDNSRGPDGAVVSSLDAVPVVKREGLKEKLQNATDEELKAGRISDVVHKTTTAPYDTRQGDGGTGQGAGVRPGAGRDVQGRREPGGAQYSVRTETPNFKRWFGDSKVVDDNGDPLVVYHATTSDIGAFSLRKSRGGFYFTPSAKDAYPSQRGTMSSDRGLNVMPVYLSIKNPFVTSDPKDWHALDAAGRKRIEKLGHDGVVVANSDGSVREYVAFDPTQIKSATGNTGEFSPTNPSILASQRASQKNPAASRVGNDSASRFERTEALKAAIGDLQEGKITQDEYNRMVDDLRPVYPYEAVPPVTTKAEATFALANGRGQSEEKAAKYGLPNKELQAGDFAQLRLDIPSYQNHDAWVVSVHTPKSTNTAVQAAYDAGPVVGYESAAALTDAYFGMNQKAAAKIAAGTAKGTIATVFGKWKPISVAAAKTRADAAIKDPAWTQVGMDPFRHSYFYDRDTMRPVLQADEVIQIGPLVLAKNATFSEDNMDVTGNPILFSQRTGRETEGWILSRDETGRFRFGAGAKAYRAVADVASAVLDKIGMKPVSPELSRALRKMKTEIEKAQNLTVEVATKMKELPEQERQMISDVIEGELKRGAKPPKHVLELAASLQSIMSEQTAELVRLGMLSPEAAGRWDGKYLPRFYESKLGEETKAWAKAVKGLLSRKRVMQGIKGSSLKSRGMFQNVPAEDLQDWLDEGWEKRDDTFDPAVDDTVMVWRDYTRDERDDMGEIRDAMFRFVMGYNKSQRDIALGKLYENLAENYASRTAQDGYVQVPNTTVEDTTAKIYGKLAGKWVPKEVLDQLTNFDSSTQNDLLKMYLKGLSMWKEGKTVLNPVSHANNILSNLTMAHFAGVSYWDANKYVGAIRDLVKNDPMIDEARDVGLFGGTFNRSDLLNDMPEQLKALAQMSESKAAAAVDKTWNALSFFLRKPAGKAYEAEDLFFRYLIYRDARKRGMEPDDAVDYSQQFIFTYDDLPKGARLARDFALPFFSYTYKVVPVLARTALEHPARYAAPAAALYTVNALMYAMAASLGGGEDEDWWTVIRRYVTDPEFRDRARALEKQERENLPPWMKGASATLGTPKAIRLGMDDVTNLPLFLDVSRVFPGGDLLDANANAGGVPLLQPITPSNPILNTVGAMIWNKDPFFGKDIVDKNDTSAEAAAKRGKWLWQQFSPAVAVGNYHWDRALNVIANVTGQEVLGYTGTGKDGLPVQPGLAAAQTVGIKMRPIDLDLSAQINDSQQKKLIRDMEAEMRQLDRLESKGAIGTEAADKQRERQQQKIQNVKEGLTVEGKPQK